MAKSATRTMAGVGVTTLALVGLIATPASAVTDGMVVNGSFEQPSIPAGSFGYYSSIPGWTLEKGQNIEVQNNVAGAAYDGAQLVELASDAPSSIYQDIPTTPGRTYTLQLAYSPRPNTPADENELIVKFGGAVLTDVQRANTTANTEWDLLTFHVVGAASSAISRIELIDPAASGGLGDYVDDVTLTGPPPASLPEAPYVPLLALSAIPAGFLLIVRRRGKV